ncbi:MAG: hypothetical protein H7240_03830 [Glaciimonas sp.]|nr:hypothetical protein [Glaciimonas sp.]
MRSYKAITTHTLIFLAPDDFFSQDDADARRRWMNTVLQRI